LGTSHHIDGELLASLADRVGQARRLYGHDASYVIGLVTGIDWLLEGVEGGARLKEQLHGRILDPDAPRPTRQQPAEASPAAANGASLAENTWIKGVVKWFNNDKGYGFISTESHVDVFVHWRDISSWDRSLTQGDEVEFMVTRTAKGFQAINVMKAGKEGEKEKTAETPATEAEGTEAAPADPAAEAQGAESQGDKAAPGESAPAAEAVTAATEASESPSAAG
jgi:CspA family cold shock protein